MTEEKAGNGMASGEETDVMNLTDLSDNLGVKLCVRLKPELYKKLEEAAEAKKYPNMSSFIRRIVEEAVRK